MAEIDPEVAAMFKRQLAVWKNALAKWTKKCKGAQQEQKERTRKRPLVSLRGSSLSGFKDDKTLSDATPYGYPSKSPADEAKDQQVEKQAANCQKILDRIRKTIEHLNNARTTGKFSNLDNLKIGIRKQPKFITSIDRAHTITRGDVVEVEHLHGDWLQIRSGDAEGWIHKSELMPKLPIEFSSESGGPSAPANGTFIEEVGGARDTVDW